MADIAALGISIDSSAALKAASDLGVLEGGASRATTAIEALASASSQSATAQKANAEATESAAVVSTSAADRLLASVEKQIALFGASADAVAHYNGVLAGMAETELEWYKAQTLTLQSMQAQAAEATALTAAQTANVAAGERFIASLVTQSETIGLSKTELLEYKAAQLGVTEQAAPLIAAIEAQTAALAADTAATSAAAESADAATARFQAIAATALEWAAAQSESAAIAAKYAESVDAVAAAATEAERAGQSFNTTLAGTTAAATESTAAVERAAAADDVYNAAVARTTASLERKAFAITATGAQLAEYDARLAGASEAEVAYQVMLAKEIELRAAQMAAGTKMAAQYVEEGTAAAGASLATASFTREVVTMGNEINRGDTDRLAGSFVRLLNISGALDAIFSPIGIAILSVAAATGVMTLAAAKGEEQWKGFNDALILTGNSAGLNAAALQGFVNQIQAGGERAGVATKAITDLANTGRFTSDQILMIGTAATQMADATGTAVDKTIGEFVKLQEDPVKASAALNDQYHYLTAAVFDQIDALQKQGDMVGAADAAEAAYATALGDRAEAIRGNLGTLQTAWKDIGDTASEAWNAMLNIGKPETIEDKLAQVAKSIAAAKAGMSDTDYALGSTETTPAPDGNTRGLEAEQFRLQNEQGASKHARADQASYQTGVSAGVAGRQTLDNLQKSVDKASELQQKLDQAAQSYKDLAAAGTPVSQADQDKLNAEITKKYTPHQAGGNALNNAEQQQPISLLKDQYDQQNKILADQREVIDNDHKARVTSDKAFYDQENQLNDQQLANSLAYYTKLEALLRADIASSSTSSLQKIKDQNALAAAVADANVAVSKYAATSTEIADQVTTANNKQSDSVNKYIQSLNDQIAKEQEANERRESAAGVTSRQRSGANESDTAYAQRINSQGAQQISDIQAHTAPGTAGLSDDQIQKLVADVQAADATMVANHKAATQEITQADQDWESGAEKAWTAWSAQASNLTGQVNTATTNLLNGLTDNLLKFAETGKANFQALADSFVGALAKMEIQAAESKVFSLINGALPGGSTSGALGLLGALFGSTSSAAGLGFSAGIGADVAGATGGIADAAGAGLGSQFAGLASGFSTGLPLAAGFATGGHVTGPGSSTSDSIPARLSNGEFVVNASATAQHRPLLEALNGGRGSPGQTHFATGGLVSGGNGQNGAGTNISFNITSTNASGQQDNSPQAQNNAASLHKQLEAAVIEIVRKNSQPGGQINSVIRTAVTQ